MSITTAIKLKFISIIFFSLFFLKSSGAIEALTFYAVDFPPYEFENPKSPDLRGFDIDVIVKSFERVGIVAKIEFLPWKRIVSLTKSGEIAGMVSCAKKQGRETYVHYSNSISGSTHAFIVTNRYKGQPLKTLEDARGLRVLAVAGYTTEKELINANVEYEKAANDQLAIKRLLERPYDTFYSIRENIEYLAKEQSFSDKVTIFDIIHIPYHLCIAKKWPNSDILTTKFNEGLSALIKDGSYKAIHDKYR